VPDPAGRPSDRIRLHRSPKKGRYERGKIEAILDRCLVGHIAFIDRGEPACLTVTALDGLVLARSAFQHSANYESVVAFGRFREVTGNYKITSLAVSRLFAAVSAPGTGDGRRAAGRVPTAEDTGIADAARPPPRSTTTTTSTPASCFGTATQAAYMYAAAGGRAADPADSPVPACFRSQRTSNGGIWPERAGSRGPPPRWPHTAAAIVRRVPGDPSAADKSPVSSARSCAPSHTSSSALTVCSMGECARS
jgi:hypothetical protein